ncbi:hypothetical protein LEP1GSC052_1993 [Leptospira kmetyi serovar Malaysia str. Bejo-Iso9]|nr:hypothetical protein LEP1GSC052_1993 [Leptospira kmetyi serovar Malaysia str. Bejo-Iso9]
MVDGPFSKSRNCAVSCEASKSRNSEVASEGSQLRPSLHAKKSSISQKTFSFANFDPLSSDIYTETGSRIRFSLRP